MSIMSKLKRLLSCVFIKEDSRGFAVRGYEVINLTAISYTLIKI